MSDPTEGIRQALLPVVNSGELTREALEAQYGQVWDSEQLAADFVVRGFLAPFVIVYRKADSKKGSLTFCHQPRWYHSFVED